LRFQDGHVPELAAALVGARPGDVREAEAKIGTSSPDPALRGQTISVAFHVHDLKQLRLPQLDTDFLSGLGFDSPDELRDALEAVLERRYAFEQQRALRTQILDELIRRAPFELPSDLVQRQERSTLRRLVDELRESGLSDSQIRGREAELRSNAHERTLRSLKEHFLLDRIADAEKIKVDDVDLDLEIRAIAARADESPRRVRARIEREGLAEGLSIQILERKTIAFILDRAQIEDIPLVEEREVETIDEGAAQVVAEAGDAAESEEDRAAEVSPSAS
jgi:trigger factor